MKSIPEQEPHRSGEMNCTSTFTFLGDVITLGHALPLTSYQPRWSINFGASLPTALEKLFAYAFHVSLALALLNSLPVYFLDGECTLEVILQHSRFFRQRTRRRLLQWILVGGTFLSVLVLQALSFSYGRLTIPSLSPNHSWLIRGQVRIEEHFMMEYNIEGSFEYLSKHLGMFPAQIFCHRKITETKMVWEAHI